MKADNKMQRIINWFIFLKYPFLRYRNAWTGKKSNCSCTILDNFYPGWKKAFGKQFCKELRKVLIKEKMLNKLYFLQVKEKYGSLRLYPNCTTTLIQEVLNKYELLSMAYCQQCGKPVRYATEGWISYICEDCFMGHINNRELVDKKEYIEKCRLTEEDIPIITTCDSKTGEPLEIDLATKYGVNFTQLWGLKNK